MQNSLRVIGFQHQHAFLLVRHREDGIPNRRTDTKQLDGYCKRQAYTHFDVNKCMVWKVAV